MIRRGTVSANSDNGHHTEDQRGTRSVVRALGHVRPRGECIGTRKAGLGFHLEATHLSSGLKLANRHYLPPNPDVHSTCAAGALRSSAFCTSNATIGSVLFSARHLCDKTESTAG